MALVELRLQNRNPDAARRILMDFPDQMRIPQVDEMIIEEVSSMPGPRANGNLRSRPFRQGLPPQLPRRALPNQPLRQP